MKIHMEKQQTREKARVVEEAQAEAKERIAKKRLLQQHRLQGRPIRINAVTVLKFEEEMVDPIIQVMVGCNKVQALALVDTGAQGNLISLSLYNRLAEVELQATEEDIQGFTGHHANVIGSAVVPLQLGATMCTHHFYIVQDTQSRYQMMLGQPWQRAYNAQVDWSKDALHFQSFMGKHTIAFVEQLKSKGKVQTMEKIVAPVPEKEKKAIEEQGTKMASTASTNGTTSKIYFD